MRGLTRRGAGSIGLCWVLCVAVAGCTEAAADPPPSPPATADASPSPTPTPTAAPVAPETVKPERPAAMDTVDVDGAKAVATYFLQLYPYVYATGDLEEWRALSHPDCVFCASVVEHVEERTSAGVTTSGGAVTLGALQATEISAGEWFAVTGTMTEDPGEERDAAGSLIKEWPDPQTHDVVFAVIYDGRWLVRELDVTSPAAAP